MEYLSEGGVAMKKKLLTLLMGTFLVMSLAACGGGTDTSKKSEDKGTTSNNTAQAGDAQKIYDQKCSSCHGADMKGQVGPNLTKIGSKYSQAEISDILKNGKSGGMPAGLVSGDDATKVAEWLATKK